MAHEFNIGRSAVRARGARTPAILALAALFFGPSAADVSQRQSTEKPLFETPRIIIEQAEQDFGDVIRGETIEAVFELKNVGAQPLRVLRAQPG